MRRFGPDAVGSGLPPTYRERFPLTAEASDHHHTPRDLGRAWLAARRSVAGRRSSSHPPLPIDILAAALLLSATTLARLVGLSI